MSGASKAVAQVTKFTIPDATRLNAMPLPELISHKRLVESALETLRNHYNEVASRIESLTPNKNKPPRESILISPVGIDSVEVFGKVGS